MNCILMLATVTDDPCGQCSKRDSNPHSCNSQGILSPSCLPFHHSSRPTRGAENETRTRDPDLGKVVLYQLSYFRNRFSVPRTGLEPARLSARAPETRASTIPPPGHYERKTRLELATPTLARSCSTN